MNKLVLLVSLSVIILATFSVSNPTVFGEPFSELTADQTRATALDFSVKPLDNWAYQNAGYGSNIFGFGINNAVEMWPNQYDIDTVYGLMAKDGHYTAKNVRLDQYVEFKTNEFDRMINTVKWVD